MIGHRHRCLETDTDDRTQTQMSGDIHRCLETYTDVWRQTQMPGDRHRCLERHRCLQTDLAHDLETDTEMTGCS